MIDFQDKYNDLIKRGYFIEMYEDYIENQFIGCYKAYFVKLTKPNQIPFINYSKESYEKAVIVAHEIIGIRENFYSRH